MPLKGSRVLPVIIYLVMGWLNRNRAQAFVASLADGGFLQPFLGRFILFRRRGVLRAR